jgi:ATP-dependent Clp protease ATP-binding subunit ClpB
MVCFALIFVVSSFTVVFKDVKRSQESPSPAILFIDELHLISVGKGQGSQSGMCALLSHRCYKSTLIFMYRDAANLLKPELARGQFRCIGATTLAEYREHIEKDGALTRRFAQVCTALMRRDAIITGFIGHGQRANNRSSQNYSTWLKGAL